MKGKLDYIKFIIEIAKYLWIFFNASIALMYSIALFNKISRPEFKNLSSTSFIVIGVILLVSIGLNYWVIKQRKSPSN
ncbi:hypothetical protein [Winogradskyella sp.]|uniref:hypothetical protein n=1 Tax=Winogradskyella sp. TaxID=1883156 RepID=UPI0025F70916|nr:hypothetical protein [Winogradskyella sp.]